MKASSWTNILKIKKNMFSTFSLEHVTHLGEYILYIVIAKDKIIWNGLGLRALV